MTNLTLFLLALFAASVSCCDKHQTVHSKLEKCEDTKEELLNCSVYVTQMEQGLEKYGEKRYVPMNKCLSNLKCDDAKELARKYESSCIEIQRESLFFVTCMEYFYAEVYYGKHECAANYNFSSKDPKTVQNALIAGKSCVLEIVDDVCFNDTRAFLDTDKYEKIIKSFTTPPVERDCNDIYYLFDSQHCMHFPRTIKNATSALPAETDHKGDNVIGELIRLHNDALECWNGRCFRSYEGWTMDTLRKQLEKYQSMNS